MEHVNIIPCPFCGGEGRLTETAEGNGYHYYVTVTYVRCAECLSSGPGVYDIDFDTGKCISAEDRKALAIKGWNRRASVVHDDDGLEPVIRFFED